MNGHLHRRNPDGVTWANRYVSLSTDTGSMKFYAEKSGKRTMKGQVNIKQGRLELLDQETAGRAFAFAIINESLGNSEDACLTLAATDAQALEEWKNNIEICFTIGTTRRRKSMLAEAEAMAELAAAAAAAAAAAEAEAEAARVAEAEAEAARVAETEAEAARVAEAEAEAARVAQAEAEAQAEAARVAKASAAASSAAGAQPSNPPQARSGISESSSLLQSMFQSAHEENPYPKLSVQSLSNSHNVDTPASIISQASTSHSSPPKAPPSQAVESAPLTSAGPPQPVQTSTTSLPLKSPLAMTFPSVNDDESIKSMSEATITEKPFDENDHNQRFTIESPQEEIQSVLSVSFADDPLEEDQEGNRGIMEAFRKSSIRKSFKVPTFKNILSPKGGGSSPLPTEEAAMETNDTVKEDNPQPVVTEVKKRFKTFDPSTLKIAVRPTGLVRMGYLYKLDTASKDVGEESWINQYITLSIATGMLECYAELAGRRILRGKINVNECNIKTIDYVYYGRLFVFKISPRRKENGPSNAVSMIFAAEEMDSFSYWLISCNDCKLYQEEQLALARQKEEEEALAKSKALLAAQLEEEELEHIVRSAEHRASYTPFHSRQLSVITDGDFIDEASVKSGEQPGVIRNSMNGPLTEPFRRSRSSSAPPDFALPTTANGGGVGDDGEDTVNMPHHHHHHGGKPSFEFPSTNIPKKTSFHCNDPAASAGDLEVDMKHNLKMMTSTSSAVDGIVTEVNDSNIDDILKEDITMQNLKHEMEKENKLAEKIELKVKKILYPTDRLARRVRIWYSSSGFALTNDTEIEQFVSTLQGSEDEILRRFAEEKFSEIKDWATLLELLRSYESKVIAEQAQQAQSQSSQRSESGGEGVTPSPLLLPPLPEKTEVSSITLIAEASLAERPDRKSECRFDENLHVEAISSQIAKDLKMSEIALQSRLPKVFCGENHIWGQGLKMINEDLTFAEDLLLYQEDIIKQMWQDFNSLKAVLEQKDEVINQLYKQITELQEMLNSRNLAPEYAFSPMFSSSIAFNRAVAGSPSSPGGGASSPFPRALHSPQELQAIADREFNIADRDGDGALTREEWRRWIMDKHNLLSEHNHVKAVLMSEIRNLRKALTPNTEEVYEDLKKAEEARNAQEEEIVKLHIERDNLKVCTSTTTTTTITTTTTFHLIDCCYVD
eukprot:scaffold3779_cov254-Ochromonas_danica.AAC.23